jgi:hypothetical protein
MELPVDVDMVLWVSVHFEGERDRGLAKLRSAEIHTGEPASTRMLRCLLMN